MPGAADLCRLPLLALCWLLTALAAPVTATPAVLPAPQLVADDIYFFPGAVEAPTAENQGRIANVGVIVGPQGVIVVGTGTSDGDGERLLTAIGRLSRQPVVLAIDTYAGAEHVLGNSAFVRRGIPILAHRETDSYMALNCERCLRNLQPIVGNATLAGSQPERPQRLLDGPASIVAGGRRLEILHYGPTQQPGSIAVFDAASGVLFAGGLASFNVVPDARDADLAGWVEALKQMRRLPLKYVVPVRGPSGDPSRLDEVGDYLTDLAMATQGAYERGIGLAEATASLGLTRYQAWAMYPQTHRRNVHFQYLRLERRDLAGPPSSATRGPAGTD